MTHDPVEAVVAAYLAYLEHDGPEPSLDHLSADDRRRAEELVALTNEGRGIDVYRSRPSVDMLLAGTEFVWVGEGEYFLVFAEDGTELPEPEEIDG